MPNFTKERLQSRPVSSYCPVDDEERVLEQDSASATQSYTPGELYTSAEQLYSPVPQLYSPDEGISPLADEFAGLANTLHVMDDASRIATKRVGPDIFNTTTPATQYHLGDHLGSSNVVLDDQGTFINREEYGPYGETSFGSYDKKRYRFTGKERDEESGLYYHGARYYAPWLARWAAPDPASMVDDVNLYEYVQGNPVKSVDPDGREGISIIDMITNQFDPNAIDAVIVPTFLRYPGISRQILAKEIDYRLSLAREGRFLELAEYRRPGSERRAEKNRRWREHIPIADAVSNWDFSTAIGRFQSEHSTFEAAVEQMYDFEGFLQEYDLYSSHIIGFQANIFYGNAFSSVLAREFKAELDNVKTEKIFQTDFGPRRLDIFTDNAFAHEVKVGNVSYSGARIQLAKDIWLRENDEDITVAIWHFAVSPRTGEGGPDERLREALESHGVGIVEYDESGEVINRTGFSISN